MTPRQQICLVEYSQLIKIPVKINGRGTIAMINSGATGNFMLDVLVRVQKVLIKDKEELYQL